MIVKGVLITPEQSRWLRAMIDPALKQLRRDGIELAKQHRLLVEELDRVAAEHRASSADDGTTEFRKVPDVAECPEIDWISTEEAAKRSGVSQRRIRAMCGEGGTVKGTKTTGRAWQVSSESVDDYVAQRKGGTRCR